MKRRTFGAPPDEVQAGIATSHRPPARRLFAREFADELSHAFRTPLTVIGEYAAILRDGLGGPITDKQREYLGIIAARVDDLALAVDDVLDANALEAGLIRLWRRNVRPAEILDRARRALERRAKARHVVLETEIGESLPDVYCDPEQFGRAFGNLAADALKQMPVGGRMRLSANRGADGHEVEFEIAAEESANVEGRSPAGRKQNGRPSAEKNAAANEFSLGLNVASELIRLNLGTLRVRRQDGRRRAFLLTLPSAEYLPLFERYLNLALEDARCASRRSLSVSLVVAEIDAFLVQRLRTAADGFLQTAIGGGEWAYRLSDRRWILALWRKPPQLDRLLAQLLREWAELGSHRPAGAPAKLHFRRIGVWQAESSRGDLVQAYAAVVSQMSGRSVVRG